MVRLPKFLKAAAGKAEKAKNDKLKVINKEAPSIRDVPVTDTSKVFCTRSNRTEGSDDFCLDKEICEKQSQRVLQQVEIVWSGSKTRWKMVLLIIRVVSKQEGFDRAQISRKSSVE